MTKAKIDGGGDEKKPAASAKPKPKKMHLHEVRSVQARDGSIVHHHTYKEHPDAPMSMPERGPMATSASPEEAGQHVTDQFAQNAQGAGGPNEEAEGEEPAAGAPPEA
jgi:hypothetical protein